MADLVDSIDEVAENILRLDRYRNGSEIERRFHAKRIKNGKLFVALKIGDRLLFAPSKFAGYKNNDTSHVNDLKNRNGGVTNSRIIKLLGLPFDDGTAAHSKIDDEFLMYCQAINIEPSKHHRKRRYWKLPELNTEVSLPEEIGRTDFFEGAVKQVLVNRYERNQEARRACLDHYGYNCCVCDFNFEKVYGLLGTEFIHVHHLVPVAEISNSYKVDPVKDLRPVCPNCHAMLHKQTPALNIEKLKEELTKYRQ